MVCADTSCYIYTQDTMWLSLSKTLVKYNWKCICYILFFFYFVFWFFFQYLWFFLTLHRLIIQLDFWTHFSCKLFFPFSKSKFFFYKTKLCWCIIFSKISFMYIWIFNVVNFFKKFKIIYIKSLTAWSFNCFKLQIFWQSPWVNVIIKHTVWPMHIIFRNFNRHVLFPLLVLNFEVTNIEKSVQVTCLTYEVLLHDNHCQLL